MLKIFFPLHGHLHKTSTKNYPDYQQKIGTKSTF